jgi:predicted nucleotidyltransferase component of viral defense system
MNPAEVRKLVIVAMFSDDQLAERLVLKGGSALELVHKIVSRGSVDVDLSLADEFEDLEDTKQRLFRSLRDRFDAAGYVVFGERFDVVPPPQATPDLTPWWGGYSLRFRLIERERYDLIAHDRQQLHRESNPIDYRQRREFRIEISKHEFCQGSEEHEFEGYRIFVYSPEMTAIEKLRAICQQMDGYKVIPKEKKRPRARDFYDICAIITQRAVDLALPENHVLCRAIFKAKEVPPTLLQGIRDEIEFHRPDWSSVEASVPANVAANLQPFDYYVDFVSSETEKLQALWVE